MSKKRRRRFTTDYKIRIVNEAAECTQRGEVSALLRREGLHSSQLYTWRNAWRDGSLVARERVTEVSARGRETRREIEALEGKLKRSEARAKRAEQVLALVARSLKHGPPRGPRRRLLAHIVDGAVELVGVRETCRLLAVSRASYYRRLRADASTEAKAKGEGAG